MKDSKSFSLRVLVDYHIQLEKDLGHEMFLHIPDNWFEDYKFGCPNGHVSRMILRCSSGPRDRCLKCHAPTSMIPPSFTEAELSKILNMMNCVY